MSEEARLVAEFVGGVFIAFVSHYLTKSHYEKKRQDDKADRDYNRLLGIKDKRIIEAQECLNIFTEAAKMMMTIERKALALRNADAVKPETLKVLPLLNLPPNILLSMSFLNSPELAKEANEFRQLLYDEYQKMMELLLVLHNKTVIDEKAVDARITEFVHASGSYSGKIQVMLNKIAAEIK